MITDVLMKATPMQQICAAIMLLFIGASSGIVYEESTQEQAGIPTENTPQFDRFAYEAQDVQNMMKYTLENPTSHNLMVANNDLLITREPWAERENGANKELYQAYLKACEKVIDDMQAGEQIDTTEVNELYSKLENN